MKKIILIVDMEGCIGVYDMGDRILSKEKMLEETDWLLHCLVTIHKYDVTVIDSHDSGQNVISLKEKYASVKFISHIWNLMNIETFDFALMTGFHAKMGTPGYFSHTLRPEIKCVKLGGRVVGEIELIINFLAFYGVGVYCVTGDEGAREETLKAGTKFISTKQMGSQASSSPEAYKSLLAALEDILQTNHCPKYLYNNGCVEVIFQSKHYHSYMPSILFKVTSDGVMFSDVIEFFRNAFGLCKFINAVNEHQWDALCRIKATILSEFNETEFQNLNSKELQMLFQKDPYAFALEELREIRTVLSKHSSKTNWYMLVG